MPFTEDGIKPDIIINPHAIPSRMTIGQLKETLLEKVLLELGLFGDGTSFGEFDVKDICKELQHIGYESKGNEIYEVKVEKMRTSIFIGPAFYQRLKHMVNDKQHSRSIGPMVNLHVSLLKDALEMVDYDMVNGKRCYGSSWSIT